MYRKFHHLNGFLKITTEVYHIMSFLEDAVRNDKATRQPQFEEVIHLSYRQMQFSVSRVSTVKGCKLLFDFNQLCLAHSIFFFNLTVFYMVLSRLFHSRFPENVSYTRKMLGKSEESTRIFPQIRCRCVNTSMYALSIF